MRDDPRRHDEGFDALIDRVVREMMDVEPRPGMRERVRARIEAPRAGWWSFTLPRLAVAGAVAALLVMAVISRSTRPAPDAVPSAVSEARPSATPSASPEASRPSAGRPTLPAPPRFAAAPRRPEPAPAREDRLVRAASLDAAAAPAVEIAPIPDIEPIRIAALSQTPIVASEIRMVPLAMDQIEIAPLTVPR
jgi:hypothetical protein